MAPSVDELTAWATRHGAELHPSVEVVRVGPEKPPVLLPFLSSDDSNAAMGWSLRVRETADKNAEQVKKGDTIVACPLKLSLSYLNAVRPDGAALPRVFHVPKLDEESASSSTANIVSVGKALPFPLEFMVNTPAHVLSGFFLVREYLKGRESHWYPYISVLPQPSKLSAWLLPPFWPSEEMPWLEGTNIAPAADDIRKRVGKEFRRAKKMLQVAEKDNGGVGVAEWKAGGNNSIDYTTLLSRWAYCIFASRSFRPSTVFDEAVLDALLEQDNNYARAGVDDFSVLLPLLDIGNHSPSAAAKWVPAVGSIKDKNEIEEENEDEDETDDELEGEPETGTKQKPTPTGVKWLASEDVAPGEQVFNNYGMKTNSELLLGYGFIIPESEELHNDYVHLRTRWEDASGNEIGPSSNQSANESTSAKRNDFLVSLRPMSHHSSVVGRARELTRGDRKHKLPGDLAELFSHVETELVWHLLVAQAGLEKKAVVGDKGNDAETSTTATNTIEEAEDDVRARIEKTTGRELAMLREGVLMMLFVKLSEELQRLHDSEPDEVDTVTEHERIAKEYHMQCRKVLGEAIGSFDVAIGSGTPASRVSCT